MISRFLLLLFIVTAGCKKEIKIEITDLNLYTQNSECPDLILSPQDKLYHTWIEREGDSLDVLKYAILEQYDWSKPHEIVSGTDWFVNWADFPTLAVFAGSELNLLASYLQKNPRGKTYDYDIKLASSNSNGERFKLIDSLHSTIPGEHGFVSMQSFSYNKNLLVWLDGSNMKGEEGDTSSDHHDHGGSMQLMAAFVDINGRITDRTVLDDMTCECCQTDIAMTPKGPVVVYRNKGTDHVRDIYLTRYNAGKWSMPRPIHQDNWVIHGCPVNGPAISSLGNKVAVVWYTAVRDNPSIYFSISENAADSFSNPIKLNTKFTDGRLDICWLSKDILAISYLDKLEKTADRAQIHITLFDGSGTAIADHIITETSSKRKSGFPVMQNIKDTIYLSYTQADNDHRTIVKSKKITFPDLKLGN